MAELDSFTIELYWAEHPLQVEIKPCCKEDNIFYYDVIMNGVFQYTITPDLEKENGWRVSMINADKDADHELVQLIGRSIENHTLVRSGTS